jgi:hypothetical protein
MFIEKRIVIFCILSQKTVSLIENKTNEKSLHLLYNYNLFAMVNICFIDQKHFASSVVIRYV